MNYYLKLKICKKVHFFQNFNFIKFLPIIFLHNEKFVTVSLLCNSVDITIEELLLFITTENTEIMTNKYVYTNRLYVIETSKIYNN